MIVRPRLIRLPAVAAAALLAVTVPAAPAVAQPGGDGQASGPTPPPVQDRSKPGDDGQPDVAYTPKQNTNCVGGLEFDAQPGTIPWGQKVLRFDQLGQFATGAGQTVAVIDTGVNQHAYLRGRLVGGDDYVERGGNGLADCDGHGTAVAGVIAARPPKNGGIGFSGIAPDATILSIRQSSDYYEFQPRNNPNSTDKREKAGTPATLAKAIVRAADRGATVINMSLDSCRPANEEMTPDEKLLQRALRYAVEERDVVVVSSAGNTPAARCEQNSADPEHPTYIVTPPWFSEYVISVAATQQDGAVAEFSMHGPWVSVAAPGTNIISLDAGGGERLTTRSVSSQGQQGPIQGTSFAAPYVAGLAALIREYFEKLGTPLTAKQVMNRIKVTASHPAGKGGHNIQVGYGVVNPVGALTTKVAGEDGIVADHAVAARFDLPPADTRDWTPERVALIAAAGALGLLLLTLFIVHTVRRQRRDRPGPT